MINLKSKGLPGAIEAYGEPFLLNTDFRVWADFPEKLNAALKGDGEAYSSFFARDVPYLSQEVVDNLEFFYRPPSELPRNESESEERLIDFDFDSDYIFAAFWQTYGIDLTETEMHWHKFSALLAALPSDTMFVHIANSRCYEGEDETMLKQKYLWSLPQILTEEERKAKEEFDKFFG